MRKNILIAAAAALALSTTVGCDNEVEVSTHAGRVESRGQLIGGVRGLGEVGDYVMENRYIRAVVQDAGFSRGFGIYGGSLIDVAPILPNQSGNSYGSNGTDQLGELFPAFFLQATAVDTVEVVNDGSDGEASVIRASGYSGEFLQIAAFLDRLINESNENFLDANSEPELRYSTEYILEPDARHIRLEFTVENLTDEEKLFPSEIGGTAAGALGLSGLRVPMGEISLFGKQAKVFIPGVGFDLTASLDRIYAQGVPSPNFPGVVGEFIATRGEGTSYGMLMDMPAEGDEDRNYIWPARESYEALGLKVYPDSMLVPFTTSGFIGVFYEAAPEVLAARDSYTITKYFVVGNGDVGSVLDEIHRIRGTETGRLTGRVVDPISSLPADGTTVFVYQREESGERRIYSQYDLSSDGVFMGNLAPGLYSARVAGEHRITTDYVDFEIVVGETTNVPMTAGNNGQIVAQFVSESGTRIPGKLTAVGVYGEEFIGMDPRSFLFEEAVGESFRSTDFVADTEDPETRQYIENFAFADDGMASMNVRPGTYDLYLSRGPEFEVVVMEDVTVAAGDVVRVSAEMKRAIDTDGWLAGDFHIHSIGSIDSGFQLNERIRALAAEGIEWATSTDHNYITDFTPYIAAEGLQDLMGSSVGLEMTTLESGHFNGYPLSYDVGPTTHGAFEWSARPPDDIFRDLRALGAHGPENTIIQVNHPRDTILGYFNQFERSGLTAQELPGFCPTIAGNPDLGTLLANIDNLTALINTAFCRPDGADGLESTYSEDFDALEILNGKLFYQIHHFRAPAEADIPADVSTGGVELPPEGTILMDPECDLSTCTTTECECEVEFPGAIDDWYNLLNLGKKYIGVGTSDSHSASDESGYFRTMMYVGEGNDNPANLGDMDIVRALRSRHSVATNGPLVDYYINSPTDGAMGSELVDTDGTVTMHLTVAAADWVGVDQINIVRNGLLIHTMMIDDERSLQTDPVDEEIELQLATDGSGNPIDSWFVVEAFGKDSFFPIVVPQEVPPTSIEAAIGTLAGPIFGSAAFGDVVPGELFQYSAYAMTNPTWVKTESGRGFEAPGVAEPELQVDPINASGFQVPVNPVEVYPDEHGTEEAQPAGLQPASLQLWDGRTGQPAGTTEVFSRDANAPYDVRTIFGTFGGGGHGH